MGVLAKLFGGDTRKESVAVEAPPCPHAVLMPRWESVSDMGKEDLATRFICEACDVEFTPAEARELREGSVTDRLLHQEEAEQA